METHWLWFIAGLAMLIAELFTGTFYMLVISVAMAAGGVVAWMGGSLAMQYVVAAAVGFIGAFILRKSRFGMSSKTATAQDPSVNPDIGNRLEVDAWDHLGRARVMYRGAQWDVELEAGLPHHKGEYLIKEVRGATLIVGQAS
jgi:membrane protein implicated in regulation of membrane protease activity